MRRTKKIGFGTIFRPKGKPHFYFENKPHKIRQSLGTDDYDQAVGKAIEQFHYLQHEGEKKQQELLLRDYDATNAKLEDATRKRLALAEIEAEYMKALQRTGPRRNKIHHDAKDKIPISPNTVKSTKVILSRFVTWLNDNFPSVATMDAVTSTITDSFFDALRSERAAVTYNNYRHTLHGVWETLHVRGGIKQNPFATVKPLPKATIDNEKYPKRPFTQDQLKSIFMEATDWLLPASHLGYETGLRLSDVCCLRRDQLDLNDKFLDLRTREDPDTGKRTGGTRKTGAEHCFYIPQSTPFLIEWLKTVPENEEYVFPQYAKAYQGIGRSVDGTLASKHFMHFLRNTCKITVERIEKIDGEKGETTPGIKHTVLGFHSFRANRATYLRSRGASIAQVQEQLGHSDQDVTKGYIQEETASIKARLIAEYIPSLPMEKGSMLDSAKKLIDGLDPKDLAELRLWLTSKS